MDGAKKIKSAMVEGRARVMWGDPPDEVADWMAQQGVEPVDADGFVRDCTRERNLAIRKRGTMEMLIGGGIALASVAFIVLMMLNGAIEVRLTGGCSILACIGISRFFKGWDWFSHGGKIKGSL